MTDQARLKEINLKRLIPELIPTPKHLIQHHLKSFNYLLTHSFPKIIKAKVNNIITSEVKPHFKLRYRNIKVLKPTLTDNFVTRKLFPHECRLRDIAYSGEIKVDIEIINDEDGDLLNKVMEQVTIGKIPIMLGSDYCWLNEMDEDDLTDIHECKYDPRGYFVINGVEKVVLMQEQMCKNKVLVDHHPKDHYLQASCASATLETKSKVDVLIKGNIIYLDSSSFEGKIPLFIILKAMGVENDKKIVEMVEPFLNNEKCNFDIFNNLMYMNFESLIKHSIVSQSDALIYLSSRLKYLFKKEVSQNFEERIHEVHEKLSKIIIPHIPATRTDYLQKVNYIAFMTRRLLRNHLKLDTITEGQTDIRNDRDFLGNKRIECAGEMLGLLFEDLFKRFNSELKSYLDKEFLKLKKSKKLDEVVEGFVKLACSTDTITNGLIHAISSGNWKITRFKVNKKGVTQVLDRINHLGAFGMLTRLQSHIEKSKKVSGPRSLQCSHWGFICPVDTPDGENCGLVKTLALLAKITIASDDRSLLRKLDQMGVIELGICDISLMKNNPLLNLVFLNGKIIGGVFNGSRFADNLKRMRRRGEIDKFTSVLEDKEHRVIDIWTDSGRLVRPLINYTQLQVKFDKFYELMKKIQSDEKSEVRLIDELLSMGILEYLDVNELNNCNIAFSLQELKPDSTHIELSYNIILGIISGMIPYPHHNQSPRNTYQCAMGKQALGVVGLNQQKRIDTVGYQLVYPQKPLVTTSTIKLTGFEQMPAGMNATIAIMSFSGYDIEDAVVMSRGAIERGFGRTISSRKFVVEFEQSSCSPNREILFPTKANSDGIVDVGERVDKGDILVNKHIMQSNEECMPFPERYKGKYPCRVEKILLTKSGKNDRVVKMSLSKVKIPEIGDKFSSRHGQKGVMGIKIGQSDLPFSETGWMPDLIMNPHGFPSRMTVGKLMELISSKASALSAQILFGNAFDDKEPQNKDSNIMKEMGDVLLNHGYNYDGTECLISGSTGEYIKGYIFSGPVYYQRLKHMVSDKIHARAAGKKTMLTRQPLEGRAKEGGLRLGEMERDCLLAYGASEVLIERFLLVSDEYHCSVCEGCGGITCSGNCGKTKSKVRKVRMPYPTKLLLQELASMNINPKIKLK